MRVIKNFGWRRALAATLSCALCAGSALAAVGMNVLSSDADMISGGDTLVQLSYAPGQRLPLVVKLNGNDVTGSFRAGAVPNTLVGLVSGLQVGNNTLRVLSKSPATDQSFTLVNYPITGPIFSGPHQTPYNCETTQSSMGAPLDSNCSATTRIDYFYRTTAGNFTALTNLTAYPVNLSTTTIYGGATVPYIVRVESGTINRGIYRIAILDDPVSAPSGPWRPGAGWNGKLQIRFGGGCGSGKHQGNNNAQASNNHDALSRGFAVATSTLNVYGTACDDLLSAETAMMVKEHFTKHYGVPRYTMGEGGSGGGMQQHLIGHNYPGILDGIVPERSFPDGQTLSHTNTDAALLNNYFPRATVTWTDAQKLAISGFGVLRTLTNAWAPISDRVSIYTRVCPNAIPVVQRYNAVTNPGGVRCTIWDSMSNYYGKNPVTGFAYRAIDNVGVQYGLKALNNGVITVDQFLDLNQLSGGFDVDGNFIASRTVGDLEGIQAGYRTGRVIDGRGMSLPILDLRIYLDDKSTSGVPGTGNVHTRFHSFEMRQRLIDANGTAANQVMWVAMPDANSDQNAMASGLALDLMDQWLMNLNVAWDEPGYAAAVLAAKPAALKDGCWDPTTGQRIDEPATFSKQGQCNTLFPYYENPRIAAGAPLQDNVVKCVLKPIAVTDYIPAFTSQQAARLQAIFPTGVCDFSKPRIGKVPFAGPWQSFGPAQ